MKRMLVLQIHSQIPKAFNRVISTTIGAFGSHDKDKINHFGFLLFSHTPFQASESYDSGHLSPKILNTTFL
jgi:hypothetical protein